MIHRALSTFGTALLAVTVPLIMGCQGDEAPEGTDTGGLDSGTGIGGTSGTSETVTSATTVGTTTTMGGTTGATSSTGAIETTGTTGSTSSSVGGAGGVGGFGGSVGAVGAGGGGGGAGVGGVGAGGSTATTGAAGTAGAGGTGGAECGTLDLEDDGSYVRTGWTAEYACEGGTCPAKGGADMGDVDTNAFDGSYQTRWSTGVYQSVLNQQGMFPLDFTVDMTEAVPVSKLTTHPGCQDIYDSPGTIEVEVSIDGTTFTTVTEMPHTPPVPGNEACPPTMDAVATDTITFPTTCARYVRLKGTQRTTSDRYWAIGEMSIYP